MLITGHTHEVRAARGRWRGALARAERGCGAAADSRHLLRPQFKAYKYEDRLFINPVRGCVQGGRRARSKRLALTRDPRCLPQQGSATGAYSPLRATSKPSFVLMDVDGARVRPRFRTLRRAAPRPCARADSARLLWQLVAYVYQLVDGEVKVDKIEYMKQQTTAAKSA